jgi:hypothetical protein
MTPTISKEDAWVGQYLGLGIAIGLDIVRGMNTGKIVRYPVKRPLWLRCSAWRIILQRFVHLQNLIGSHGI